MQQLPLYSVCMNLVALFSHACHSVFNLFSTSAPATCFIPANMETALLFLYRNCKGICCFLCNYR